MTCPACKIASSNVLTGHFNADCLECQARFIAQGPLFAASQAAGKLLAAYKAQLQSAAGIEWESFHQRVKRWAGKVGGGR